MASEVMVAELDSGLNSLQVHDEIIKSCFCWL